MATLFQYFTGSLRELIEQSLVIKDRLLKKNVCVVSERLIEDLASCGVSIDATYQHVVDNNAIRHAYAQHALESETLRGQVAITKEDIEAIPQILENYDDLFTHKNRRGQDVVVYSKIYKDGTTTYVEEVRVGRKELAMDTIYKRKNGKLTDAKK